MGCKTINSLNQVPLDKSDPDRLQVADYTGTHQRDLSLRSSPFWSRKGRTEWAASTKLCGFDLCGPCSMVLEF